MASSSSPAGKFPTLKEATVAYKSGVPIADVLEGMRQNPTDGPQNPYFLTCASPYAAAMFKKYSAGERQTPSFAQAAETARPVASSSKHLVGSTMSLFAPMSATGKKALVLSGGRVLKHGNTIPVDTLRTSPGKKPFLGTTHTMSGSGPFGGR